MFRREIQERENWRELARQFGFGFHSMYDQPYWDETAYYQFTLEQIERDLEAPTEELHQMCLEIVDEVVRSEQLLAQCAIPEAMWSQVASSWQRKEPSLYSRMDFAYNGSEPAKLLENNADTPTSLFETGFWQWVWLEDVVNKGRIHQSADQFNILQDFLIERFAEIGKFQPGKRYTLAAANIRKKTKAPCNIWKTAHEKQACRPLLFT